MKIEFIKSHTHRGVDYGPGDVEDFPKKEAERIRECGSAKLAQQPAKTSAKTTDDANKDAAIDLSLNT